MASSVSPIVVIDYDDEWPLLFEQIAEPVRKVVADLDADVQHVGSTAVPGLRAKPVIDMDVVVRLPEDAEVATERLGALGYVHQGNQGIAGREALIWPRGAGRHHLYVVIAGSQPHRDHIAIRDHLRAHPETARRYGELKGRLADQHADDRLAYTNAKAEFVTDVLRTARQQP
jgi:GrpB-like predicted nucleotidyltransferase (UPF0157 family)